MAGEATQINIGYQGLRLAIDDDHANAVIEQQEAQHEGDRGDTHNREDTDAE
jgi:hypothetical protein